MKKELCYPFLYDESNQVEYEILTDKLSSQLGVCASHASNFPAFQNELLGICEKVYHMNGSIRGRNAIKDSDVQFLKERYSTYEKATKDGVRFVLPAGTVLASNIHLARSMAKDVVRKMYKLTKEGIVIDEVLFDYANMVSNYCFLAALFSNMIEGHKEIEFISESY